MLEGQIAQEVVLIVLESGKGFDLPGQPVGERGMVDIGEGSRAGNGLGAAVRGESLRPAGRRGCPLPSGLEILPRA
ncbi:hypothetical protein GCM10009544_64550 [Streptomyces stramineus]|uniref:Uncharacterized protein n=1 Tax=Streptomyces stramineus TaxID=173861 RepID=A0ABN1BEQ7_9ACTN